MIGRSFLDSRSAMIQKIQRPRHSQIGRAQRLSVSLLTTFFRTSIIQLDWSSIFLLLSHFFARVATLETFPTAEHVVSVSLGSYELVTKRQICGFSASCVAQELLDFTTLRAFESARSTIELALFFSRTSSFGALKKGAELTSSMLISIRTPL